MPGFRSAALTCVTGVSGSGKSTLVHDVLARAVRRFLHRSGDRGDRHRTASRGSRRSTSSSRSTRPRSAAARARRRPRRPGLFAEIRRVFAMTREAKIRGYGASRFSFNAKGGRCEACQGLGQRKIPMHFLPDLHVTCDECGGKRFNRQTLEVRFKGKSIGDVLEMRVDECRELFDAVPRVLRGLEALHDVGLGYLTLGQSSTTLSGGEAQRIKLAAELGRPATGRVALHPRRADHRPALRRHRAAARDPPPTGRPGPHRRGDRAPARRDRLGRLGDRPGPGRGRRRRPGRGDGAADRDRRTLEVTRGRHSRRRRMKAEG